MVIANDLTVFEDKFDRTDRDLDGDNGWEVIGSTVGGSPAVLGSIEIFNTYATPKEVNLETMALQEGTVLKTFSQEVRAKVVSWVDEVAGPELQVVGIGLNGARAADVPPVQLPTWGVLAMLRYKSDGTRTLDIAVHNSAAWVGGGGTTTLASKVVILEKNESNTDLGVLQDLMLRIDKQIGGHRIRVYLNNDDYAKPDMEIEWTEDFLTILNPYIYFAAAIAARNIAVTSFQARDIEDDFTALERTDAYTVKYVLDQAKLRYKSERNPGDSDVSVDLGITYVREAQAEIVHRCGDMAYFLYDAERMELQEDANKITKMPLRVNRIVKFTQDVDGFESSIGWELIRRAPDGRLEIRMNPPASPGRLYRVFYQKRYEDIDRDQDQIIIPKHHTEALILGVCRRYAEYDGAAGTEQMINVAYERQVRLLLRDCNKQRRMTKDHLYGVGGRRRRTRYESEVIDQYGY